VAVVDAKGLTTWVPFTVVDYNEDNNTYAGMHVQDGSEGKLTWVPRVKLYFLAGNIFVVVLHCNVTLRCNDIVI
jgi:hypothetical protein